METFCVYMHKECCRHGFLHFDSCRLKCHYHSAVLPHDFSTATLPTMLWSDFFLMEKQVFLFSHNPSITLFCALFSAGMRSERPLWKMHSSSTFLCSFLLQKCVVFTKNLWTSWTTLNAQKYFFTMRIANGLIEWTLFEMLNAICLVQLMLLYYCLQKAGGKENLFKIYVCIFYSSWQRLLFCGITWFA